MSKFVNLDKLLEESTPYIVNVYERVETLYSLTTLRQFIEDDVCYKPKEPDFTDVEISFLKLIFSIADEISKKELYDFKTESFDSDTLQSIKDKLNISDLLS